MKHTETGCGVSLTDADLLQPADMGSGIDSGAKRSWPEIRSARTVSEVAELRHPLWPITSFRWAIHDGPSIQAALGLRRTAKGSVPIAMR